MGALLLIETFFMSLATGVSVYYSDPDIVSTTITFLAGLLGLWFGRHASSRVGEREGYVIVAMVWVIFSLFGLLPYYLSGQISSFTDAWFETMSGFTTTGATILNDVESLTHAALFWRAMTQWLGGLGIIVLCVALLPMFGLGGMQLYAAEVTGVNYEKLSPNSRHRQTAVGRIYLDDSHGNTTAKMGRNVWLRRSMPLVRHYCHRRFFYQKHQPDALRTCRSLHSGHIYLPIRH